MADYATASFKWGPTGTFGTPGGQVTWSFATANHSEQFFRWDGSISDSADQEAIRRAFAEWESVCDIDFVESADSSDVDIRLGWDAIDGPYNVVAESYQTYRGATLLDADIRFDSAETWANSDDDPGIDLYAVALHEIGHAIGLDHYDAAPAIMNSYVGVEDLTQADIDGARALYGYSPDDGLIV